MPNVETLVVSANPLYRILRADQIHHIKKIYHQHQGKNIHHHNNNNTLYLPLNIWRSFTFVLSLDFSNTIIKDLSSLLELHYLQSLTLIQCQIEYLPEKLGQSLAHLKQLDLSINYISDITQLKNCHLLKRLSLYNNQIRGISMVSMAIKSLGNLEEIDLRYNPITKDFYDTINNCQKSKNIIGQQNYYRHQNRHSNEEIERRQQDTNFMQNLNDSNYCRRNIYRSCILWLLKKNLKRFDGLLVTTYDMNISKKCICMLDKTFHQVMPTTLSSKMEDKKSNLFQPEIKDSPSNKVFNDQMVHSKKGNKLESSLFSNSVSEQNDITEDLMETRPKENGNDASVFVTNTNSCDR